MNVNNHKYQFINLVEADLELKTRVLSWRNHASISKWMYNSAEIDINAHLEFIDSLRNRKDKLYIIVKRDDDFIGVFSLVDFDENEAEWGYYLAPEFHNKSLGVEFYYAVLGFCFEILKLDKIHGYAKLDNKNAISLNSLFGFESFGVQQIKSNSGQFVKLLLTNVTWNDKIVQHKKILKLLTLTR